MRRILPISTVLISILILVLNISMASDYPFGSKVMPGDNDSGLLLKNIPDGAIISFWDIGSDLGFYDSDDVVYLDMPPIAIANANDLRLTEFGMHLAGTKIKPDNDDMNAPLKSMQGEICFLSLNGGRSYNLNDPVYLIQSDSLYQTNSGDTRDDEHKIYFPVSDNIPVFNESTGTASTATNTANINPNEGVDNESENPTEASNTASHYEEASIYEGFSERLSYSGECNGLPKTTICLIYSDNYIWPVSDLRIDDYPTLVGFDNSGFPIEAFRCADADYYHILGTLLVRSISKDKTLFIQSAPNRTISYTMTIRANDIRLTSANGLDAGTKVQNFEPDLNMPVAYPILASFPRRADDYAGIRVYDANGNGLYDYGDDVYLDISFPGYSSFGTVSINDVRLSGPPG